MTLLRKLHTLTEIGAMAVNAVTGVLGVRLQKQDSAHEDRIAALEAELAEMRKHATKRPKK